MTRFAVCVIVLFATSAALAGKSADECRAEVSHLPEDSQQNAVIECLLNAASPSPPPEPEKKRPKPTIGKASPAHIAKVRKALENKLRDPYSAVLADLYTLKYPAAPKDLAICGTVNAKNAYGAYIGKRPFYFADDAVGQTLWVHGTDDFESSIVLTLCGGK